MNKYRKFSITVEGYTSDPKIQLKDIIDVVPTSSTTVVKLTGTIDAGASSVKPTLQTLITEPILDPWIKTATAMALAAAFGCFDIDTGKDVDPTVEDILKLTDQEIRKAPDLGEAAIKQVHALRDSLWQKT